MEEKKIKLSWGGGGNLYFDTKMKHQNQKILILNMLIFHSFMALGSTFSRLHQRLLKSFNETALALRYLGKSVFEGNLYLGPLEIKLQNKNKLL